MTGLDADAARLGRGIVRALSVVLGAEDPAWNASTVDLADVALLVDEIARQLDRLGEPRYLVVDDAHRLADTLGEGLLGALIDAGPPSLRIVLVGSVALERSLARRILTHPAGLIRADQLRFDLGEVRAVADSALRPLDAEEIWQQTGGWPIAVRFAAFAGGGLPRRGPRSDGPLRAGPAAVPAAVPPRPLRARHLGLR